MKKRLCACVLSGLFLVTGAQAQESKLVDHEEKPQVAFSNVTALPFGSAVTAPQFAPNKPAQVSGRQRNPFANFVRTSAFDLSRAGVDMVTFRDPHFAIGAWTMVLATIADMQTGRDALNRCPSCTEGGIAFHNGRPTTAEMLSINIPVAMLEIGGAHWLRRTARPDSGLEKREWLIPVFAMDAAHGIAAVLNSRK